MLREDARVSSGGDVRMDRTVLEAGLAPLAIDEHVVIEDQLTVDDQFERGVRLVDEINVQIVHVRFERIVATAESEQCNDCEDETCGVHGYVLREQRVPTGMMNRKV